MVGKIKYMDNPKEKALELLEKIENAGCVAEPEVMKHSAKRTCVLLCREVIQELAYGKTNSVSEEQLSDYHARLLYWNEVLSNVQKHEP